MRLEFVEVCGFRGFRNKIRFDLASGFNVINGRNGVGKSTFFDAIEFALTGGIHKFHVEKSAGESVEDYIWWRGEGKPQDHYACIGFVGEKGERFVVTRRRDTGCDRTEEEIEDVLCSETKPEKAIRQLCLTSLIRDEWISELSLDQSERDRFEHVKMAIGASVGADYHDRAKNVLELLKEKKAIAKKNYEDRRHRLHAHLAQLSRARDEVNRIDDVTTSLEKLGQLTNTRSKEIGDRIKAGRDELAKSKVRLNALSGMPLMIRSHIRAREKIESESFRASVTSKESAVAKLQKNLEITTLQHETDARNLQNEESTNSLAASLSALVEHGATLGLHEEHCPLCAAARTNTEFKKGIDLARARLALQGTSLDELQGQAEKSRQIMMADQESLSKAKYELNILNESAREYKLQTDEIISMLTRAKLGANYLSNPKKLERVLEVERNRLIELETAVINVELSKSVERFTEMETNAKGLEVGVAKTAEILSEIDNAVSVAEKFYKSVRQISADIVDERLALMNPLLNELYERLRPHKEWRNIDYNIRGDVQRFLSLRVGDNLNPQFIFSSGQKRTAGLAFLLAVHLSRSWSKWNTLLLDDPVQHIDDFRALHLVEVLAAIRMGGRQVICSVEDPALADLLCRRLISLTDGDGKRFDFDIDSSGATYTSRELAIAPVEEDVLRRIAPLELVS